MTETTTRRSVLTKIGVGATVAWTAPTVLTMNAVASASGAPPTTGSIGGQIRVNGAGRPDFEVTLFDSSDTPQGTQFSDPDGFYSFATVPDGTWRVGVTTLAPNVGCAYSPPVLPYWNSKDTLPSADPIVVNSAPVTGIDVDFNEQCGGSISGQVTINGAGTEGFEVTLFDSSDTPQGTQFSDPDGFYSFATVPDGTWRVGVTVIPPPPPNYTYSFPQFPFWDTKDTLANADPIVINAAPIFGVNFNFDAQNNT